MNRAHLPGFTGQASLYRAGNGYCSLAGELQRAVVIPQLGGPGYVGLPGCIQDCLATNPRWTREQCRRMCTADPSGGPPPPPDQTNRVLSNVMCWAWWAACEIDPFGFGCDEIRDHCLANIQ
jgi:hypothetical protein